MCLPRRYQRRFRDGLIRPAWCKRSILLSILCVYLLLPVIANADSPTMRAGIVGASLINFEALGRHTGETALRVLKGERVSDIPPESVPNIEVIDWRQLRHWGIDELRVPAASTVRFKTATFWDSYKWYVLTVIAALIIESSLIAWLLLMRRRRRQAEAIAENTHRRLHSLISDIPGIVWETLVDPVTGQRRVSFISDHVRKMLGYTPQEWLETPGFGLQIVAAEDRERVTMAADAVLASGNEGVTEFRWRTKDGQIRWAETHLNTMTDGNAGVIGLRGVTLDVTKRKAAEASVLQSEERFSKAFRLNPQPMSLTTIDEGRYLDVNDSFLAMSGYTRDEILGHTSLELGIWETSERRVDFVEQLKEQGSLLNTEKTFRSKNGSIRLLLSSAEQLEVAGQRCLLLASTDITERKKAEEELREAHEQLQKLKDQLQAENIYLQEELKGDPKFGDIVGRSDAVKKVLHHVNVVAPTEATVLITGETGTGKELVARAIHAASSRHDRPLIRVNCGALPASLIEPELFGHEKGAFTGAISQKAGRFELANGGTIFLDEIGELTPESQVKLLRVIQEGEFERVGGTKTIKVDVRIIAATNRNLKAAVDNGTFREDLWYRLNVFPITVPPLRHRREDIPLLTEHFVMRFAHQFGKNITGIAPASVKALREYSWPGNIRELANVLERVVINTNGSVLRLRENLELLEPEPRPSSTKTLTEVERDYIVDLLEDCGWRVEGAYGAAQILGLNPSTLRSKMSKLGIKRKLNGEDMD